MEGVKYEKCLASQQRGGQTCEASGEVNLAGGEVEGLHLASLVSDGGRSVRELPSGNLRPEKEKRGTKFRIPRGTEADA